MKPRATMRSLPPTSFSDPNGEKQSDGYSNERPRVGRHPITARSQRTS
jgi:hypothetical protein